MAGAIEEPWAVFGEEWRSAFIPDDMVILPAEIFSKIEGNIEYMPLNIKNIVDIIINSGTRQRFMSGIISPNRLIDGKIRFNDDGLLEVVETTYNNVTGNLNEYLGMCIDVYYLNDIMRAYEYTVIGSRYVLHLANRVIINRKYDRTLICYYPPLCGTIILYFDYLNQPTNPIKIGLKTTAVKGLLFTKRAGMFILEPKTIQHLIDVGSTFYASRNDVMDTKPGPETPLAVLARRQFERLPKEQRRRIMENPPAGLESALERTPLFTHMHTSR